MRQQQTYLPHTVELLCVRGEHGFKPVGALTVRGFPYEPDYSTSRIMWGTDNLIVPNYAAAYVAPVVGTVPGLRVTPVTNGVRIQADAWQGGDIPSANIEIPLTFAALDALVVDERAIRPTCRFDVVNGGGILQHRILLANDAIPAGGSGLSFTLAANTVGNDILVKNSPSETVSRDPILNILRGANPRIIYKISYASVANIPAMDVTIRNVSIVAQTVMAPTKEVSWTSSE